MHSNVYTDCSSVAKEDRDKICRGRHPSGIQSDCQREAFLAIDHMLSGAAAARTAGLLLSVLCLIDTRYADGRRQTGIGAAQKVN
jgi:hypothetical protein